jgi:hypothetical protein
VGPYGPGMPFLSRSTPAPPPLPYDPSSPEGLAARWVQWVAAASALHDPVADETGEDAAANQPDDVWFLAGSYGEVLERRCTVPAGRALFVPVFTLWSSPTDGPPESVDGAHGSLVVDGVSVAPETIATPVPVTVTGARSNGVTRTRKPTPMTVWGLWKLLPPLAPGAHELNLVGSDGHGFVVDVRYHLLAHAPTQPLWG